jgi:hypothetical protein
MGSTWPAYAAQNHTFGPDPVTDIHWGGATIWIGGMIYLPPLAGASDAGLVARRYGSGMVFSEAAGFRRGVRSAAVGVCFASSAGRPVAAAEPLAGWSQ